MLRLVSDDGAAVVRRRVLASGSWDKTIRLWDVRTHKQLGTPLTGNTEPVNGVAINDSVNGVAFSPDGQTLASASADNTVWLWEGILWRDFAELQKHVCRLVGSGLSRTEWGQYAAGISYRDSCP